MRRLAILLIALSVVTVPLAAGPAAAAQSTAGGGCSFPVTLTDATGQEITLEERPERVTTTNPSAAQTMWDIGGRSQVVGLTEYAMYLEGASERTDVSAEFGVDVEKVVGTEPDLVLAPNASAGDVEALRQAGLTVYHLPAATDIDDIRQKTTTIGTLTGNCEGAAEVNAWMDANVAAVEETTAGADRPRVLHPLGGGYVVGDETFIDSMLEIAGAQNVAAADHTGYVQLNAEVVLQLDPEVLVLTHETATLVSEQPYASTTAGLENSTVLLETSYLHQAAPRSVVYTVHNATRQLHPERYSSDSYVPRSAVASADATETAAPSETTTPTVTDRQTGADEQTATGGTDTSAPGFGVVVALLAVFLGVALAARVR
jgi:iron complex transport system substrate-binding protein